MYSLRYEVMVQMLQQFGYSGEVHAKLPPQAPLKEGGRVVLIVLNGSITASMILQRNEQKLYHEAEVRSILMRLKVLEWELVSSTPTAASPADTMTVKLPRTTPANGMKASSYPHRLVVSQSQMYSWSKLQRSIYFLADGTRNIERIAMLLSCSVDVLEQSINELQSLGAIERLS
jgi:hypothetical protein